MEFERLSDPERLHEQLASILLAKNKIVRNIWATIPTEEKIAFQVLEMRLEHNPPQDPLDFLTFWKQYSKLMRKSGSALNARLRQNLVSTAFVELMGRYKERDGTPVVLFRTPKDERPPEILSAFRFEQDVYINATTACEDQARQDIIMTIIKPDDFAKAGLARPDTLVGGVIVTDIHNDSREIVAPTFINGVMMRFNHRLGSNTPIVEFVPKVA